MSRARRRKRGNGDRLAFLVLCVAALFAAGIGAFVVDARRDVAELDGEGCRTDGAYDALVFLFDRSDALNSIQKIDVRQRVVRAIDEAPVGTRVSFAVLDAGSPDTVSTLFRGCRPADGRNVNHLTQNERMVRERWREGFLEPLEATLDRSLSDAPSATSPIMEAIQIVALTELAPLGRTDFARRLIIVSDMIQNTKPYNQYRDSLEPERFRRLPYASQVAARLDDTMVEVHYVGRANANRVQTTAHATFWDAWIRDNGGRVASIERIAGG